VITVAEVVEQLVARSPFISEALSEGLVNVSALARRLQPEVEQRLRKTVKPGAIIMAVNRMSFGALTFAEKDLRRFFRRVSDVSVRSSLLDYTFANSDTLLQKQARLLDVIGQQPRGFYTFSQGIAETTIIVSEAMEAELERLFEGERMLDKEQELSVITLILPEENRTLYGVYYYILKELAWHGINLVELISTSNEFSVVVKDEDLERAFALISSLRRM
jgi:aspartokinase